MLFKGRELSLQSVFFFKCDFNESQTLFVQPITKIRKHQLHQGQINIFELFGTLTKWDVVSHKAVTDNGKELHLSNSEVFYQPQSLFI